MTEITATRQQARETEDGALEVTFTVHRQCKAAFFEAFAIPGAWAVLSPKEKPATQGAVPLGTEQGELGMASAPYDEKTKQLADHPYFQQFALVHTKQSGDAKQIALALIRKRGMGIGGLPSPDGMKSLLADYKVFCATKGWNSDC